MSLNTMGPSTVNEADAEKEKQRSESEARGIEKSKMHTLFEKKKTRCIWDLFRNAKE